MLMTMEPAAFIDGMRALITREVVANASITFGESEASVTRGLTAALPMVLGALATKAGNRSLMSRVFDLIQDPAAEDCAPGNVANLVGPRASITLGVSLGNRFVSLLLGNNTESIGRVLSSFAGVRLSTAASMLSLAGPLALGYLGKPFEGKDSMFPVCPAGSSRKGKRSCDSYRTRSRVCLASGPRWRTPSSKRRLHGNGWCHCCWPYSPFGFSCRFWATEARQGDRKMTSGDYVVENTGFTRYSSCAPVSILPHRRAAHVAE